MKIREARCELADKGERFLNRLAHIARCDCNFGGAKAMVIAHRFASRLPELPLEDCVAQAYASSTGTAKDYLAYECPECGCAVLGYEAAAAHCSEEYQD